MPSRKMVVTSDPVVDRPANDHGDIKHDPLDRHDWAWLMALGLLTVSLLLVIGSTYYLRHFS